MCPTPTQSSLLHALTPRATSARGVGISSTLSGRSSSLFPAGSSIHPAGKTLLSLGYGWGALHLENPLRRRSLRLLLLLRRKLPDNIGAMLLSLIREPAVKPH